MRKFAENRGKQKNNDWTRKIKNFNRIEIKRRGVKEINITIIRREKKDRGDEIYSEIKSIKGIRRKVVNFIDVDWRVKTYRRKIPAINETKAIERRKQ